MVDDIDFGITHVVRGNDHRPNEAIHRRLHEALGTEPPEYVHHGLILGPDGKKLSKRAEGATVASLREAGIPGRGGACDTSRSSTCRDTTSTSTSPRVRRLAIEAIEAMPDAELAARVGVDERYVPAMRGARDLVEAREYVEQVAEPPGDVGEVDAATLQRFAELVTLPPRELLRELRAAGGDLRSLRLALTGREHGPELAAVLEALSQDEALRRAERALAEGARADED